jgi:hypothetical protein
MSSGPRRRKRRASIGPDRFPQLKRRRKYAPWRLLFIVVVALLAGLVMLGRVLKPLRVRSYSHTISNLILRGGRVASALKIAGFGSYAETLSLLAASAEACEASSRQ